MNQVAIVVLANAETLGDLGRVVNALSAVEEFKQAGDDVKLIFDGAGVRWIGKLAAPDHDYHEAFNRVRDRIDGVCEYCAGAFQVTEEIRAADVPFAGEFEGHPSFRALVQDGYQVITF